MWNNTVLVENWDWKQLLKLDLIFGTLLDASAVLEYLIVFRRNSELILTTWKCSFHIDYIWSGNQALHK